MQPSPRAKSGINFLLEPSPDPILTSTPPTPTSSSADRLAALSLEHPQQLPSINNNALLPPLLPMRARSADSGIPDQPFVPHTRFDSRFSDVTMNHTMSSGPSLPTIPATTAPPQPPRTIGRRGRTEAEIKEKREMRRMKNRISAARSRQRKTDTFETLQRELREAKEVIEVLTMQLDRQSGGRPAIGSSASGPVIAVPQDLRAVIGHDFVSADNLMDLLRMYIRRSGG